MYVLAKAATYISKKFRSKTNPFHVDFEEISIENKPILRENIFRNQTPWAKKYVSGAKGGGGEGGHAKVPYRYLRE